MCTSAGWSFLALPEVANFLFGQKDQLYGLGTQIIISVSKKILKRFYVLISTT